MNDQFLCKICYNESFDDISYSLNICSICYCVYCQYCKKSINCVCQYCKNTNFIILDTRKSEFKSLFGIKNNNNNFNNNFNNNLFENKINER